MSQNLVEETLLSSGVLDELTQFGFSDASKPVVFHLKVP